MATKTPNTRNEQDTAFNPAEQSYHEKFDDLTKGYSTSAEDLQKIENYANEGGSEAAKTDENDPSQNIKEAREQESEGAGWVSTVGGGNQPQETQGKFKGFRKKGPLAFIIGLFLGGGTFFSIVMAPGIGIVHMKELLTEDLNDQLAATELRSNHMLRAKLKGIQAAGVCSDRVQIRCQFTTMNKKQVQRFKDAGFTMETERTRLGRERVVSMSYTIQDGPRKGQVIQINNPQDLTNAAADNVAVRSALRRAFNPKFFGMSDGRAQRVFRALHTDKSQKVSGNTDEERAETISEAVAGEAADIDPPKLYETETDEDGNERRYIVDDVTGDRIYESGEGADPDRFNQLLEDRERLYGGITDQADRARVGGSAAGNFMKSVGRGLSITGAADTACTIYNTARAVSAAAKVTRAIQLAQFFMIIANTADMIKAGEAQPGDVAFVGTMLATIDTAKTVVDEESIKGSSGGDLITEERDNPYYGKNAYDSEGYKAAAYNDASRLSARASQYMVGGALSGTLSKVMDTIEDVLQVDKKDIRSTCKVIQSWWARTIGLVAGLVSAVGTFGASTVVSISVSVAIGFAMPFLQAALADIIAGKVVGPDTKGVDAGNATFAGGGVLMGNMAKARGMAPANKEQIKDYALVAAEVKNDYIAMETFEARDTPFDINNQYSFLGSAVRSITPAMLRSTGSVSGALLNIPTLLGTAASSVIPTASAVGEFNQARFEQCEDSGYEELGIDADIFCNPRYYMPNKALNTPTEEVLNWMLQNGHINNDGEPESDDFKDWIKNCPEREDGWGETSNDEPSDPDAEIGLNCVKEEYKERNMYFGAYFMDLSIDSGMDEEEEIGGGTGTTKISGKWANPAGEADYTISSPFGPRRLGMHDGIDFSYRGDFFSACDGTIKAIGNNGDSNGFPDRNPPTNILTIDCGGGITTKYMHYYHSELADGVKVGATIEAGAKLAKVNNQGYSTGPHLHFQVEDKGKPIDPDPFMQKVGVNL